MKQRLPRKYKKQVKKIVKTKIAIRSAQCALIAGQSCMQMFVLSMIPKSLDQDVYSFIADKSLKAAELTSNTAQAISKIMSEKPNSWRDFLR